MDWKLDKTRPICPQICEIICAAVVNGEFSVGQKIFSVREVALLAGVNPNTVQKSFDELESLGVIHSIPCSGWYVNENIDAAAREVEELRVKKSREYLLEMIHLGCNSEDIFKYLKQCQGGNL